jgi:hypothetical protein
MIRIFELVVVVVVVTSIVPHAVAQDLIVSSFAMPIFGEATAEGPYYPGPSVSRFPVPEAVPLLPTGFPLGDLTMDNATGVIYHTNGTMIGSTNHPAYAPITPVFPPFPAPPMIGPLTGIAIDSAGGILWCTDGAFCVGVSPVPGTPVIVPVFPLAPLVLLAPPVTGLDWDPVTGSLWAVTSGGAVYNFLPGPVALAPTMLPLPNIAGIPVVDIVVDRHPGAFPGIYVQCFGLIANYVSGVISPTPAPLTPGIEDGIAYHNYPNTRPSGCGCLPVTVGTLGTNSLGNIGFAFTLSGVAPFDACAIAIDFAALLPPVTIPGGCALYVNPLSPSLLLAPVSADGTGFVIVPIPLALPPVFLGAMAFAQFVYPCPGGFALADSQQFILDAP